MSTPHPPPPAKLFFGILWSPEADIEALERRLEAEYGAVDGRLPDSDFGDSDYYDDEMGKGLKKRIVTVSGLIDRQLLPDIKLHTNRIERSLSREMSDGADLSDSSDVAGGADMSAFHRTVNIDPGVFDLARVTLATGKNFAHRIYVRGGIYEEVTLLYRRRPPGFDPLPWTYPDYRRDDVLKFFNAAREAYHVQARDFQ